MALDRTYQLNVGGNTDFLNMLDHGRTASKRVSKTDAVQSVLPQPLPAENIHIGPSDYVAWQRDNKICFLRMEGRGFANAPVEISVRLVLQRGSDFRAAGCVIDAIRRRRGARPDQLVAQVSSYLMKHPPQQVPTTGAR
jgi:myo-inositol-1-phosphate synthase